jgi:hypothetical protein
MLSNVKLTHSKVWWFTSVLAECSALNEKTMVVLAAFMYMPLPYSISFSRCLNNVQIKFKLCSKWYWFSSIFHNFHSFCRRFIFHLHVCQHFTKFQTCILSHYQALKFSYFAARPRKRLSERWAGQKCLSRVAIVIESFQVGTSLTSNYAKIDVTSS